MDNERDANTIFKKMLFVPKSMLAEHIAVIRSNHNDGIRQKACLLKRLYESTHHLVKIGNISQIAVSRYPDVRFQDAGINSHGMMEHSGGVQFSF